VATSRDTDADIDFGESIETDDQERLIDLKTEDLGLDEVEGGAVDLDESATLLAVSDSGCRLLLAEALNRLSWSSHRENSFVTVRGGVLE